MVTFRLLAVLTIAALLVTGCASVSPQRGTVAISSTRTTYSPFMSSTVGFDLTPVYAGPDKGSLRYRWTADYGTFVWWDAPDFKVEELGKDAITGNGTIYWTYRPETTGGEPVRVTITLSVEDVSTGTVFATGERHLAREGSSYRLEIT